MAEGDVDLDQDATEALVDPADPMADVDITDLDSDSLDQPLTPADIDAIVEALPDDLQLEPVADVGMLDPEDWE